MGAGRVARVMKRAPELRLRLEGCAGSGTAARGRRAGRGLLAEVVLRRQTRALPGVGGESKAVQTTTRTVLPALRVLAGPSLPYALWYPFPSTLPPISQPPWLWVSNSRHKLQSIRIEREVQLFPTPHSHVPESSTILRLGLWDLQWSGQPELRGVWEEGLCSAENHRSLENVSATSPHLADRVPDTCQRPDLGSRLVLRRAKDLKGVAE